MLESRRVRLFIIDSHRLVRDGLRARLSVAPLFEIVGEADNLSEALVGLDASAVDVLLMDIGVAELGDIELEGFVEHVAPTAVLVLSWHAEPTAVARAMRAGARGFMLKDAPTVQLLDAVQTVSVGGTCLGSGIAGGFFRGARPDSELSRREREVLHMVGQGLASKTIAQTLNLSLRTVESHRQNIKRKLQLKTHAALIRFAVGHAQHTEDDADLDTAAGHSIRPPDDPTHWAGRPRSRPR